MKECDGSVKFENVSFAYSPDAKLLDNIDITVRKGERIAIVGPTGCGKTTLINLLMRFYDPVSGRIFVSGVDTTTSRAIRSDLCSAWCCRIRGYFPVLCGIILPTAGRTRHTSRSSVPRRLRMRTVSSAACRTVTIRLYPRMALIFRRPEAVAFDRARYAG